jgi:hypothetical protein
LETTNWISAFETTFDFILPFKDLIEKSVSLRGENHPEYNESLKRMASMYDYLDVEIKKMIKNCKENK